MVVMGLPLFTPWIKQLRPALEISRLGPFSQGQSLQARLPPAGPSSQGKGRAGSWATTQGLTQVL